MTVVAQVYERPNCRRQKVSGKASGGGAHLSLSQPQQIIGRYLIELGELDQMGDFGAFIVLPCVDCPAAHSHGSGKIGLSIAVRQALVLQAF